ncbi:MAG TPA: TonB-dependent siderophore receptor [Terracidiphilus sp.]
MTTWQVPVSKRVIEFSVACFLLFLLLTSYAKAQGRSEAGASLLHSAIFSDTTEGAGAPECSVAAGAPVLWQIAVTDGSGAVVQGARVRLRCGAQAISGKTGAEGQYATQIAPGSWLMTVESAGFAPEERLVVVEASNETLAVALRVGSALDTVHVTADEKYVVNSTESGLKMELPLAETPQAITVVGRELLDAQGAVKLDDALKNSAGVIAGGYYDGWDYYRIRGFDASFNTYIDGLRGGNGVMEETWGLESVEVLKGPSSALYGQSVLGGLVNIVTRKPVPAAFAHVQLTAGSFNFLDPAIDVGGSLNRSHTVYGRLAALYHSGDTFVDYTYRHRYYFAPSLTWRPTGATALTLMGRIQRDNGRQGMPMPAIGTVLPNVNGMIPINRYNGELEANANKMSQANQQFGYQFVHSMGEHFSLNQNARFAWYQEDWNRIYYPGFLGADQRTLYRYPLSWHGPWQTHEVDTHFDGHGSFWGMDHAALLGFDFYRSPSTGAGSSIDFSDLSQYEPLDLFDPVYGANPVRPLSLYTDDHTVTQYAGTYLQDHIRLPHQFTVTGGGRLDIAKNESAGLANQNGRGWTPRLGVTWQAAQATTFYASFSKSYLPQSGQVYDGSASGTYLAPERGQQWEGGAKNSLWGGRVLANLALFQLNRKNVSTSDPSHPNFYLMTGEQRSRGVELEATLHPLTGWNLTTAYSYVDAEVVHDTTLPEGTPTLNAPKNLFNAWTTYEISRGAARGVTFGIGGRHYTDQSGDLADSFRLPGYGIVDASLTYRYKHSNWQVNGYNLGDARYASGSYNDLYVKPGEPRTVRGTVAWNF